MGGLCHIFSKYSVEIKMGVHLNSEYLGAGDLSTEQIAELRDKV